MLSTIRSLIMLTACKPRPVDTAVGEGIVTQEKLYDIAKKGKSVLGDLRQAR